MKYLTEYLTAAQLSNLLKTDQGVTRPGAEDGLHSNGECGLGLALQALQLSMVHYALC